MTQVQKGKKQVRGWLDMALLAVKTGTRTYLSKSDPRAKFKGHKKYPLGWNRPSGNLIKQEERGAPVAQAGAVRRLIPSSHWSCFPASCTRRREGADGLDVHPPRTCWLGPSSGILQLTGHPCLSYPGGGGLPELTEVFSRIKTY